MRGAGEALIIGGGFYGLYLAEHLARRFRRVVLCEREPELMRRASYHNQARVHNGYHYPRSILTASRSCRNFPRFVEQFRPAIDDSFVKVYAVGRRLSKVSARQFLECMRRIGAPIRPASRQVCRLFDPGFVEGVFETAEFAFDADRLKDLMTGRVRRAGVEVRLRTTVSAVEPGPGGAVAATLSGPEGAARVEVAAAFNCTYSALNQPAGHRGSVPLKHELTELALVEVPDELRPYGITVMDGPFFSCMPFPARGVHTLSHVRYTPHGHWYERGPHDRPAAEVLAAAAKRTAFPHMARDAARYTPALAGCRHVGSLWEVKTVLPKSEVDDSRPILFRPHAGGIRNYHLVMGAKIDNVYDVAELIDRTLDGAAP